MLNTTVHAPRLPFIVLHHATSASPPVQTPAIPTPRICRAYITETMFRWGTAALLFSSGAVAVKLLLWMGQ